MLSIFSKAFPVSVCVRWKINSGTYLGAKTFHTIRCLLRIAAAQTEEKTFEESEMPNGEM